MTLEHLELATLEVINANRMKNVIKLISNVYHDGADA